MSDSGGRAVLYSGTVPMNAADAAIDDLTLLRDYSERGSERAFAELVGRHMPQVYAAALRRVNGDRALAADVTQTVFTDERTICNLFTNS